MAWIENIDYKDLGSFEPFELLQDKCVQTPYVGISGWSHNGLINLNPCGRLGMYTGHQFSASGPAPDSPETARAVSTHDALYQLKIDGILSTLLHKEIADDLLYQFLIEDNITSLEASIWHTAVTDFGSRYWDPEEFKRQRRIHNSIGRH